MTVEDTVIMMPDDSTVYLNQVSYNSGLYILVCYCRTMNLSVYSQWCLRKLPILVILLIQQCVLIVEIPVIHRIVIRLVGIIVMFL